MNISPLNLRPMRRKLYSTDSYNSAIKSNEVNNMPMTRKHYIVLADILNHHSNTAYPNATALLTALLDDLTSFLKQDHRRFDRDKFLSVVHDINHNCKR